MAKRKSVDKAADEAPPDLGLSLPEGEARHDPRAYAQLADKLTNLSLERLISSNDVKRLQDEIGKACARNTGMTMEEASRQDTSPLQKFRGFVESSLEELGELNKAVDDALELTEAEKKKIHSAVARTERLQKIALENPAIFMVYVGRSSEKNEIFKLAPIHLRFFQVWTTKPKGKPNSLIMAPPAHGKSTCFRYYRAWRLGHHPEIRCLILTDGLNKAKAEVNFQKQIFRSDRFRALFPEIKILSRQEAGTNTNLRFALTRKNTFSRELTVEGAAIQSQINGSGYDWLTPDDLCPPSVAREPTTRNIVNAQWESVIRERLRDPSIAQIDMICTPWDEDDVSGRIQKDVKKGRVHDWTIAIDQFRINNDAKGKAIPIWGQYDSAYLENKKITLSQSYTLNYRLMPREDKEKSLRKVWYYNSEPFGPHTTDIDRSLIQTVESGVGERWLSIDPSATANRGSSDNGIVDVFLDTNSGLGFITDGWTLSLGPSAMQDWIVDKIVEGVESERPFDSVLMEAVGGMKGMVTSWIDNIRRMLIERNIASIPAFLDRDVRFKSSNNMSKGARLRECSGYLENGLVRFAGSRLVNHRSYQTYLGRRPDSMLGVIIDQMLHFNPGGRTDGVDAVTQWILHNRTRLSNQRAAETTERPRSKCPLTQLMLDQIASDKEHWKNRNQWSEEDSFLRSIKGRIVA